MPWLRRIYKANLVQMLAFVGRYSLQQISATKLMSKAVIETFVIHKVVRALK